MNMPKVSIVIPVYNTVDYLESCVLSALEQNYENFELICVDNNSSDGSLELLLDLEKKYEKLKVYLESTQGAPAARNTGLSQSTGEWVQFLDSDDLLMPDKIKHQMSLIATDENEYDVIIGGYYSELNGVRSQYIVEPFSSTLDVLVDSMFGCTCSNLWRKSTLDTIGGWRVGLHSSQERDLFFRVVQADGHALRDNTPLTVIRRRTEGSISSTNMQGNIERIIAVLREISAYVNSLPDEKENKKKVKVTLFGKLRELTNYDLNKALDLYKEIFPDKFIPDQTPSTTPMFLWLIKAVGFSNAHKIRNIFK